MNELKLYEITDQYQAIFNDLYDEETGEINPEKQEQLNALDLVRDKKCVALASYIKNLDAERAAIETARKAMAARESALKKQVEKWENYLTYNMSQCGINEIKHPYFNIKLTKSKAVDIVDEDLIPKEYQKVEVSIRKGDIRKELLAGASIPGATLKENLNLSIK